MKRAHSNSAERANSGEAAGPSAPKRRVRVQRDKAMVEAREPRPSRQKPAKPQKASPRRPLPEEVRAFLARTSTGTYSLVDDSGRGKAHPSNRAPPVAPAELNRLTADLANAGLEDIRDVPGIRRNPNAIERHAKLRDLFRRYVTEPLNHIRTMMPRLEATYEILDKSDADLLRDPSKTAADLRAAGANTAFLGEVMALDEDKYCNLDTTMERIRTAVFKIYDAEMAKMHTKMSEAIRKRLKYMELEDAAIYADHRRKNEEAKDFYEARAEQIQDIIQAVVRERAAFEGMVAELIEPKAPPASRHGKTRAAGTVHTIYTLMGVANIVIGELKAKIASLKDAQVANKDPLADMFKGLKF